MGGKSKQAQRTKNNVRPSSSGRSAELLGAGGVGGAGGATLFPTLALSTPDPALAPDLALCIKKLNKKDPITKTKALQELTELVQNSKVDDVVAMLPNWCHFYRTLSVDPDRRVRELTQACHAGVVGACGRRVAPHLKALLPSWVAAQHDDHAPARLRAQHSLHSTFPDNKLPDAISFCKAEIVAHLVDNLLDCDAAVSKKVEAGAGAEEGGGVGVGGGARATCSALGGVRYVSRALPAPHSAWLWGELAPLLHNHRFWKLHAHPAAEVRSAWYGAVGALAERFGGGGGGGQWAEHSARALRTVLGAREGGGAMWTALVLLLRADPEWYSRLEKKEVVTKRIIELASAGAGAVGACGEGGAGVMPALLRLLPPAALSARFCDQLFDALFAGLERRNVGGAGGAWAACVGASVRAVCEREDGQEGEGEAGEVRRAVLARWLRAALPAPRAVLHCCANEILRLLRRWAVRPRLELAVRTFWQSAADLGGDGPGEGQGDGEARVTFLLAVHDALLPTPKKRSGVRFADELDPAEQQPVGAEGAEGEGGEVEAGVDEERVTSLLRHQLVECVARVCAGWLAGAGGGGVEGAERALTTIMPLLETCGTRELWTAIGNALAATGSSSCPLMCAWAALRGLAAAGEGEGSAVHAAFLLLPHLADHQQRAVIADIEQLGFQSENWLVAECAASGVEAARGWVRSPAARYPLQVAARRALRGHAPSARTLRACLACTDTHPERLASQEAVWDILHEATYSVSGEGEREGPATALCVELVRLLCTPPAPPPPRSALYHAVLALAMRDLRSAGGVEGGRGRETRAAWLLGLGALRAEARAALVGELVRDARDLLARTPTCLDTEVISHVARLAAALAPHTDVEALCAELLAPPAPPPPPPPPPAEWEVPAHALLYDIVAGRLSCPIEDAELVRHIADNSQVCGEVSRAPLLQYSRACLLRAHLLLALADTHTAPPALLAELLRQHAVLRELREGYAFWSEYELVESAESHVARLVEQIVSLTPEQARRQVMRALASSAAAHGYYWALAAAHFRRQYCGDMEYPFTQEEGKEDAITGDGFFHSLQAETLSACQTGMGASETASAGADVDASERARAELSSSYAVMCRCLLAAHGAPDPALAAALAPPAPAAPSAPPNADVVVDAYYRREQTMLLDVDVSAAPWREAACSAAVARFLCALLAGGAGGAGMWDAPAHHWDFTNIALSGLLASLDRSKHAWGTTKVSLVSCAALRLLRAVCAFVRGVREESARRQPPAHVAALPAEWADVFAPPAARHLLALLLHILEEVQREGKGAMCVCRARVVSELCGALREGAGLGAGAGAGVEAGQLERAVRAAGGVLAAPAHRGYKYLAYYTLTALAQPLVLNDAEKLRSWSSAGGWEDEAEGEAPPAPPAPPLTLDYLHEPLTLLQELVEAALAHLKVGEDTCSVVPDTDTHSLALGYLLVSAALCELCALHRGELALHCAELVRARRYAQWLLPAALRLLPAAVAAHATDPAGAAPPPADHTRYFLAVQPLSLDEPARGAEVSALACRAVWAGVCGWAGAGGAARAWRGAAGGAAGRALARVVRAHVAPAAVRAQLRAVHERRPADLPDADVLVLWTAGEVSCGVVVDERRVELTVSLSPEHPLVAPRVCSPAPHPHSPAPSTHWLAVYLAYQNGSVLQALRMWVSAVSARVEAAPQCYICYCRLHHATGRLPSVTCHQCHNKFHPPCLRKWFQSSSKSNCPLCRTTF